MAEYDQRDENEKKIVDYLSKFYVHLGVLIRLFILTNVFLCLK